MTSCSKRTPRAMRNLHVAPGTGLSQMHSRQRRTGQCLWRITSWWEASAFDLCVVVWPTMPPSVLWEDAVGGGDLNDALRHGDLADLGVLVHGIAWICSGGAGSCRNSCSGGFRLETQTSASLCLGVVCCRCRPLDFSLFLSFCLLMRSGLGGLLESC